MAEPKTRKRELSAIIEAMAELNLTTGSIVTRAEDEQVSTASGRIDIMPAWRFLLGL